VSARAAAHRGTSSLSISSTDAEEAARAEAIALVDDLKARLEKADESSEIYRRQAEHLQSRFDETLKDQAKLEERVHESEEQIEALRNEKREAAREIREMETIYEAEKSSILKEKEEMFNREEEMQAVINRLKDNINQRNADDEYRPTRHCRFPSNVCRVDEPTNISNSK
jgi:chromosome segregation ATPase